MDFVVLKVNGRDVGCQDAARALRDADEPLVVTLRRLTLNASAPAVSTPAAGTPPPPPPSISLPLPSSPASLSGTTPLASASPAPGSNGPSKHSVEVQTEEVWPEWPADDVAPERSLHDILEQDIDLEEVTLLRSETEEILGITLSCSCSSGSDELDTEVYIASVEPSSLAGRDGRLQKGDQILQVNGEDITTRELAEHMFNSPGPSITLLVSRYYSEDDGEPDEDADTNQGSTPEAPRRPTLGKSFKSRTPTQSRTLLQDSTEEVSSDRRADATPISELPSPADRRDPTRYINASRHNGNGINGTGKNSTTSSSSSSGGGKSQGEAALTATRREGGDRTTKKGDDGHTTSSEHTRRSRVAAASRGSAPHPTHCQRAPSSEHIYETIPESDSERSEHIYCEPYEPPADYCNIPGGQEPLTLQFRREREGREERPTLRFCEPRLCGLQDLWADPRVIGTDRTSSRRQNSSSSSSGGSCSTMYTNAANLQHTIEVQQELFRQSLRQTTPSRPPLPLPLHLPLQTSGSRGPVPGPGLPPPAPSDTQMEWKVKRRADGSRYITRRPVRSRVLRDRAAQIRDERTGFSTEDDAASEVKMGRYWTKAERKQHIRRRRQQQQMHQQQQQMAIEDDVRRPINILELSHKKMSRKKANADDFTTVQDLLVQGSRAGNNGKMLGLLSVTTV